MRYIYLITITLFMFESCLIEQENINVETSNKIYFPDSLSVWPKSDYNKHQLFNWISNISSKYDTIGEINWTIYFDKALTKKAVELSINKNGVQGQYTYWDTDEKKMVSRHSNK